jgi:hypothetical protein
VDHVRATLKPSSWSGLADFMDAVRESYRKDFWASLDHYVEVFVEKDAIAGTIQPITREYDVPLHVCRGYSSVSFAGEIAGQWAEIDKPIFAYYLGDFDPSGFDLERDLKQKLARYGGLRFVPTDPDVGQVCWTRLAVRREDFDAFDLLALPVKEKDSRARLFRKEHGDRCAEVDALAPSELRRRVGDAIRSHIDAARWLRLREAEAVEQASIDQVVNGWRNGT